jgi:hypothetical protein
VVAHEVGVFRDVDGLQGEAAEALAAVDVLLEKVGGGKESGGWVSEEREGGRNEKRKQIAAGDETSTKLFLFTSCAADVCPPVPGLEPCSLAAMKDILTRCEVVQTGVRREEGGWLMDVF